MLHKGFKIVSISGSQGFKVHNGLDYKWFRDGFSSLESGDEFNDFSWQNSPLNYTTTRFTLCSIFLKRRATGSGL